MKGSKELERRKNNAVFKNEDNGTWYVMARYVNCELERRTQAEVQAWLCNQKRSAGMGMNVPVAEFF